MEKIDKKSISDKIFTLLVKNPIGALDLIKSVGLDKVDMDYIDRQIEVSDFEYDRKKFYKDVLLIPIRNELIYTMKEYIKALFEDMKNKKPKEKASIILETLRDINEKFYIVDDAADPLNQYVNNVKTLLESELKLIEFENTLNENKSEIKPINVESDKIIWKGTKTDLVALYDELIKLDIVMQTKSKDQLLGKHFVLLDSGNKISEIGELKHTRKQLKEYAQPTEKMGTILKKLNNDKVDDK